MYGGHGQIQLLKIMPHLLLFFFLFSILFLSEIYHNVEVNFWFTQNLKYGHIYRCSSKFCKWNPVISMGSDRMKMWLDGLLMAKKFLYVNCMSSFCKLWHMYSQHQPTACLSGLAVNSVWTEICNLAMKQTGDSLWPDHLNRYVFDSRTAANRSIQFANESFSKIKLLQ